MVMHSIKMHDSSTGLRMQTHSQTFRIYLTEVSPRVKDLISSGLQPVKAQRESIADWNCICCLVACVAHWCTSFTGTVLLMSLCVCLSTWLVFVVGAMCSPVYCLTPHFLLSHYCFSVFLVCLPMYFPGVCSPMRFRCLTSCVCYVCLCCRSPSRGGFCFFWLLNDPLFICTWVLASSLLTRHDCNDRLDVCVLMT